ncbi:endonuclease/exonuclease/phosphatase family protein [Tautonia sociabilis]|uniref:Endonuclease n=1 Tax=Tautonia sociabilis TaxID=2080755 RepID=A0A432MMI9_9BACT|nr:endonuclease/exonuclease/phosphatase family protein [Tautonia sociabilis]RUL88653.1 endonuclease [Tautonia sociabilis]
MVPNRFRTTAALLLAAAVAVPASADEPVRIRVLSYNIHHGRGTDDVVDLDRIARVINDERPDVIALQEVDRGVERSGRIDEPAELARLTGTRAVFERNISYQGGDYGNALLTRLPIEASRNVPLPSSYEGEQRGCLVVDLEAPGGQGSIRVLATHLDYRPPDEERLASAARIAEIAAEHPDRPTILMGDLNARPDSAVLLRFDEDWTRANAEPMPTFPAVEPTRQIDYILVRPEARWRVVEIRVLEEEVASDHRPIFAELELIVGEG